MTTSLSKTLHIEKPAVQLFTRLFSGEGKFEYILHRQQQDRTLRSKARVTSREALLEERENMYFDVMKA